MKKRIIFRISDRMSEQVTKAIAEGKAKNPSELLRTALQEFLSK